MHFLQQLHQVEDVQNCCGFFFFLGKQKNIISLLHAIKNCFTALNSLYLSPLSSLSVLLPVCLYSSFFCFSFYLSLFVCLFNSICLCLTICLFLSLFVCVSIFILLLPCFFLFVYLSLCPMSSLFLFVFSKTIFLSVCLSFSVPHHKHVVL